MSNPQTDVDMTQTLQAKNPMEMAVGTDCYNGSITGDIACTMGTPGSSVNASGPTVMQHMAVRRLTPVECERLQGFPDNYTDIQPKGKATPDGPRYKALGNSMAVPVMAWIGKRIQEVDAICKTQQNT
jgi:DNA (cytosine-5)-methyltransferase 1